MSEHGPLTGVRVVEVASWTFVPAAGAILADLGADVVKVEPPNGDPQRALRSSLNATAGAPNAYLEVPNHGKRSVVLDLTTDAGHALLLRLVRDADVFLTSTLPAARRTLRIDVDDIRAANPAIVYVRGTGWGDRGPMADTGGFDLACGWASSGMAHKMTRDEPLPQPGAFFDLQGANAIAGAVGTALFKRERTGEPSVVDVSLMHVAMWPLSPDIVSAPYAGAVPPVPRAEAPNPVVNCYRTADGRWLYLVCLQSDRFWAELCTLLGHPELIDDERFVDAPARAANRAACVAALDAVFGAKSLAEVRTDLAAFGGVWAPVLSPAEVHDHPQVAPNGFLVDVTGDDGRPFRLVAPPARFDGRVPVPARAPELGQHTEDVLLALGLGWEEITELRDAGALG